MSEPEEDDEEHEPTWAVVGEQEFRSWRSSDWGRGLRCVVRREVDSDQLGRRVTVVKGDDVLFAVRTWRDQWGTWIWGTQAGEWEVAQEDGTPSFLFALIEALAWLREDDFGTPRSDEPGHTTTTGTGGATSYPIAEGKVRGQQAPTPDEPGGEVPTE